jgi:hypothetical protein
MRCINVTFTAELINAVSIDDIHDPMITRPPVFLEPRLKNQTRQDFNIDQPEMKALFAGG